MHAVLPIRALPWRLRWLLRWSEAFDEAPIKSLSRLIRWTWSEMTKDELALRTSDGLSFTTMPMNFSSLVMRIDGARDPRIERMMRKRLPRDAVFLDVGANIGTYAVAVARRIVPCGQVYAFEAHPRTFKYLRQNIDRNGLDNITAIETALGDKLGSVDMAFDERNPGATRVRGNGSVSMVTLDSEVERLGLRRIDYIKIDVEGYELPVLLGAQTTLARFPDALIQTEMLGEVRYGYQPIEMLEILRQAGLRAHNVSFDGTLVPTSSLKGEVVWARAA
ncbi:MAG: FkbM family methyltransferase [Rhodospirillales bacterium]|nr:FkbM family methyltransferase [Rhodospirillales bacterium]